MNIVGYKSGGHDGAVCGVVGGQLKFSIEGEKDNKTRHALLAQTQVQEILTRQNFSPDILCGDSHEFGSKDTGAYNGYRFTDVKWRKAEYEGRELDYVSVPHELAHITGAICLSDLPEGQACYVLLWEGYLGSFYHVDEKFNITKVGNKEFVLELPGTRYVMPYHATGRTDMHGYAAAGKIMALAGLNHQSTESFEKEKALAKLITRSEIVHDWGRISLDGDWKILYDSLNYLRDVPVHDSRFVALCRAVQDEIFSVFHEFAKENIDQHLPLVIAGGCGLNCEWNTQWLESGLFSSVFVPPVTNDAGIAIGAAAAVQFMKTGKIKMEWDVYAGENFIHQDCELSRYGIKKFPLDFDLLMQLLFEQDEVIAWIRGRYEMGARALCHRSLIASPLKQNTRDKLNKIKHREFFRPVAPVCLEEDVSTLFDWDRPSPHMLYFQKVKSKALEAVTHFDGTARVQTISAAQEPVFHQLLLAAKQKSGFGVLCNTSLNFPGSGFINRTHDLLNLVHQTGLRCFVIDDWIYIRED